MLNLSLIYDKFFFDLPDCTCIKINLHTRDLYGKYAQRSDFVHYYLISFASVKLSEKPICLEPSTIIDFQFTSFLDDCMNTIPLVDAGKNLT